MNNLSSDLLSHIYNINIEEWGKQGQAFPFDSGIEQRIVNYSIPAIEMTLSYHALSYDDYASIRQAYENNNSNTFKLDIDNNLSLSYYVDMRSTTMGAESLTWAFKDFNFKINAKENLYKGEITLISSVFFDYTAYQDLFNQSSSYTISSSSDTSFVTVLQTASPNYAELKYINNAIFSNIGQSVRHARNKGGLKRAWSLSWVLPESNFVELLKFYRQNAGIMGEFGMPEFGHTNPILTYIEPNYLENQNDYVTRGVEDYLSNARFERDSFQYQKRFDGLYLCRADIVEVKL